MEERRLWFKRSCRQTGVNLSHLHSANNECESEGLRMSVASEILLRFYVEIPVLLVINSAWLTDTHKCVVMKTQSHQSY